MQRYGTHSLKSRYKTINDNTNARQEQGAKIINMAFANVAVAA